MDEIFLNRALALASASVPWRKGPIRRRRGRDGAVIGEGWNRVVSTKDPTARGGAGHPRGVWESATSTSTAACFMPPTNPCSPVPGRRLLGPRPRIVCQSPPGRLPPLASATTISSGDVARARRIPPAIFRTAGGPLERWLAFAGRTSLLIASAGGHESPLGGPTSTSSPCPMGSLKAGRGDNRPFDSRISRTC